MGTEPEVRQPSLWRQLARHMRLLAALAIGGGLVGGVLALRIPATYEATRVIVSSDPETVPDTFGRLTETVATTDTVLEPVVSQLGLDLSTRELLESGMLRVEPVTNAAVIRMVGRSTDPRLAFDLAALAAESFVTVAQDRGLGSFQVFGNDVLPTDPERPSVLIALLLGAAVGALLTFLWVLLSSFIRDPVVTEEDAGSELGAPESFAIRVSAGSPALRRRRAWAVRPAAGLPAIWRALERAAGAIDEGGVLTCLLVERRREGDPWMIPLLEQLAEVARDIARRPLGTLAVFRWPTPDDEEELRASLEHADAILILVSEGARRAHLQELVEVLPIEPERVVGLVSSTGRSLRPRIPFRTGRSGRPAPAVEPPGERGPEGRRVQTRPHRPDAAEGDGAVERNGRKQVIAPPEAVPSPDAGREDPLADPSADVRLEALSAVGSDARPDVVEMVGERLSDPDPRVREESVAALGRIRSDGAIALLVDGIWREDAVVHGRAREEILGLASPAVARALVDQLGSKERFLEAASLLVALGATGVAALSEALVTAEGTQHRAIKALLDSIERETS